MRAVNVINESHPPVLNACAARVCEAKNRLKALKAFKREEIEKQTRVLTFPGFVFY